jgi:putative ABC transport system permease protein
MGRLLLVYRLAVRDLRRHAGQAALLLLVIAATVTTLTLALVLHGVTSNPWDRTMAATDGPDVVAQIVQATNGPVALPPGPKPSGGPAGAKPLLALTRAAGVTGYSGPYLTVNPSLAANGTTIAVFAEGRPTANTGIDRPYLTAGTWVRAGGVVLDRNVADALGVAPGDAVTLDGHTFHVVGTAVTAAQG